MYRPNHLALAALALALAASCGQSDNSTSDGGDGSGGGADAALEDCGATTYDGMPCAAGAASCQGTGVWSTWVCACPGTGEDAAWSCIDLGGGTGGASEAGPSGPPTGGSVVVQDGAGTAGSTPLAACGDTVFDGAPCADGSASCQGTGVWTAWVCRCETSEATAAWSCTDGALP